MKRQTNLWIYSVFLILFLTSPFWLWKIQPSKKLNVLIVDKTVPTQSFREHKGLVWILNNAKYYKNGTTPYSVKNDYKGFKPQNGQEYTITPLPRDLKPFDVIYLTDQYGVYKEDINRRNTEGKHSKKVYGGLTSSEVNKIERALIESKGKTLIAEFNTFASPTSEKAKEEISNLLNVEWSGWIGRYFSDLSNSEVPEWIKANYRKQNMKWGFDGEGFVFIGRNNYVVVIGKEEVKDTGLLFEVSKKGKKYFTDEIKGKYPYWFDIIEARDKNEILAAYRLPISHAAVKRLEGYGIPASFPAVIYHQNTKFSSYYFSGDYADEAEVPRMYQTKGFDTWKRKLGAKDSFYWQTYVPMMKDILHHGLRQVKSQEKIGLVEQNGVKTNSKTGNTYIQIQRGGKWQDYLIKGVNMGISKPGYFPGETAITKEEYFRWFKAIGAMNANALRIYTLHPPQFYEAFYLYNQIAEQPLYLFHGTWVSEENLTQTQDAFARINVDDAKLEIRNMIDIIHGNSNLAERPGHAAGTYQYDISKYVLGMIIGTEWDPEMVKNTNTVHAGIAQYKGNYFKTENASPFEVWLAGLMDYAAAYEAKQYSWQHSLSFTNWVTTDILHHPAEPLEKEDMVSINPNHIKISQSFHAGMFASYHIYPYYPDFMNFEQKYLDYVDRKGKKNNYEGYLHEFRPAHQMPVLVAEFGVPSSRGLTHKNPFGMNQGFHSEKEQGEINSRLYQSIVTEGYAGGLVFTWQDEWFKRTWNTMDFDNPDRRPYWNNQQTNEQHFGLLSFEPGKRASGIVVDGTASDWDMAAVKKGYWTTDKKKDVKEVRFTSDSGYFYFLVTYNRPVNLSKQGVFLLLDTAPNQGQTKISLNEHTKVETDYGVDFFVKLAGAGESRIVVDSYYDTFYYQYARILHMIPEVPNAAQKDNGVFHPIRLALNKQLIIPSTATVIPFQDYETGVMRFGNANPKSKMFDSLTDISIGSNKKVIEGRIPWQLLNVRDPSSKEVIGDIWENGISACVETTGIRVAIVTTKAGKVQQSFPTAVNGRFQQNATYIYSWNGWDIPIYYERLKKSYDIMAETFRTSIIK
ncbi:hypothetical protein J1P26_17885 [Neobacillus sp. MM2021_6]|uniref:hypothetical protein n=1 Tax=Bacillaceae TaxID=186817 RepID=UPI00140CC8DA|nr:MULTISPECIES: hypothetical protein [Bacillaceae]MBO0961579.1 hypothetical protein [Neobacillus sp. MM2021_6]NHC19505.1 hypothetical protein [Bacillus sp. MM2020_4]